MPGTDVVALDKSQVREGAKVGVQYTLERNFGEFEFDWDRRQLILRVLGHDPSKPPFLSTTYDFDTLSGRTAANATELIKPSDYNKIFDDLSSHGIAANNDWVCVNNRGYTSEGLQLYGAVSALSFSGFLLIMPFVLPVLIAYFIMRRSKREKRK